MTDPTCVFYAEVETIQHLFIDCIVAVETWKIIASTLDIHVPTSFKCDIVNLVTPAALWGLWLLHNEFVFQGREWRSIKCVLEMVGMHIHQWKIPCMDSQAVLLLQCLKLLDHHRGELLRIAWQDDAPVGSSVPLRL